MVSYQLFQAGKINLLNNSLLAITQEFSLAVFSLTLKQSILIVQGVLVHLHVIQFTRYSLLRKLSPQNFFSLAHLPTFVKPFFQIS